MSGRIRIVLLVAVLALVNVGCVSTPKDRSNIALRRSNLSLAFTDPSLKEPVPLEVVRRIIEVPPAEAYTPGRPIPSFKIPMPEVCPAVPENAAPQEPAILKVSRPRAGTYLRINDGTITLSSGTAELKLPYPKVTVMQVRDVRTEGDWTYYEVKEQLVPGVSTLVGYRYNTSVIEMTRRETTTSETGTAVFTPTPPVEVLALAAPKTRWASGGVDRPTRVAEAVTGIVESQHRIQLCGEVVESVPARLTVQDADATGVTVYGTKPSEPLVQDWLPQYGGIIGRQETHTSQFVRTEQGVVKIAFDVVSKLRTHDPVSA